MSEFVFQWHLTERCNLACSHCYQSGSPGAELSLDESLAVAVEVQDAVAAWSEAYGTAIAPVFHLTGGEPLLRSDAFELLEALAPAGCETWVLSNGTLIDHGTAERLRAARVTGVQVSLEGPQEVHDPIRGSGSFRRALRGVECLVSRAVRVHLNVTVSGLNVGHLETLLALARSSGVERVAFSRLVPWGAGAKLEPEMLDPVALRDFYALLRAADGPRLRVTTRDPLASAEGAPASGDALVGGCSAGFWGITLMPDGTLYPCRRLAVPIGNLRTDSLREVWARSDVLVRLRDRASYTGACGRCSRWGACRGCRAVAFACSASEGRPDYLADDPQCYLSSDR